jgi:hypothetical protein
LIDRIKESIWQTLSDWLIEQRAQFLMNKDIIKRFYLFLFLFLWHTLTSENIIFSRNEALSCSKDGNKF